VLRLVFAYIFLSSLCAVALWLGGRGIAPIFEGTVSIMMPLATLCGALSFAFYNYVEGIIKDIPREDFSNNLDIEKRTHVVKLLTDLKAEVVVNVIVVMILLVINYIFVHMAAFVEEKPLLIWCDLYTVFLSLAGGGLFTSVLVCVVQLKGFMVANKLREVLSIYGK
jgi:hypothetical protein